MKVFSLALCIIALFKTCIVNAQNEGSLNTPQEVMGSIAVPSIMSLQVTTNSSAVRFENTLDFTNGKFYSNFLNMKVISTQAWMVSFKSITPYFTPLTQGASVNMPVSIFKIKRSGSTDWLALSNNTQPLLYSENSQISNVFNYDARFELGWDYRSGNYTATILFTLTPQ